MKKLLFILLFILSIKGILFGEICPDSSWTLMNTQNGDYCEKSETLTQSITGYEATFKLFYNKSNKKEMTKYEPVYGGCDNCWYPASAYIYNNNLYHLMVNENYMYIYNKNTKVFEYLPHDDILRSNILAYGREIVKAKYNSNGNNQTTGRKYSTTNESDYKLTARWNRWDSYDEVWKDASGVQANDGTESDWTYNSSNQYNEFEIRVDLCADDDYVQGDGSASMPDASMCYMIEYDRWPETGYITACSDGNPYDSAYNICYTSNIVATCDGVTSDDPDEEAKCEYLNITCPTGMVATYDGLTAQIVQIPLTETNIPVCYFNDESQICADGTLEKNTNKDDVCHQLWYKDCRGRGFYNNETNVEGVLQTVSRGDDECHTPVQCTRPDNVSSFFLPTSNQCAYLPFGQACENPSSFNLNLLTAATTQIGTLYECRSDGLACPLDTAVGDSGMCEHAPSYACDRLYSLEDYSKTCIADPGCPDGYHHTSTECIRDYYWYDYFCKDEPKEETAGTIVNWEPSPDFNPGGDCEGMCGGDSCYCSTANPPSQNCRREIVITNTDATTTSYRRALDIQTIDGEGVRLQEYGTVKGYTCGSDCGFNVHKLEGIGEGIRLTNQWGESATLETPGCTFSGVIESEHPNIGELLVEENNRDISAYRLGEKLPGKVTSTCLLNGHVGNLDRTEGISSIKVEEDSLHFWDAYVDGWIGMIEIVRTIPEIDQTEGFDYEDTAPVKMLNDGFHNVIGYTDGVQEVAFAALRTKVTEQECLDRGTKYGFTIAGGSTIEKAAFIRKLSRSSTPNLYVSPDVTSWCVLESPYVKAFSQQRQSLRVDYSPQTPVKYVCSPIQCQSNQCQFADCRNGYSGTILPADMLPTDDQTCMEQRCDVTKPYVEVCGTGSGCDTSRLDIVIEGDECFQFNCPNGELNPDDGQCYAWECPPLSIPKDGKCYQ